MTIEENKALVRLHLIDVMEQGKVELIDGYYAPDGSVRSKASPAEWRDMVLNTHKNAPGFKATILDMIADGNKVAVHVQIDMTFVSADQGSMGSLITPILGKPVSWRNMNIFTFAGGKLVATELVSGMTDMFVRMGAYTVANAAPV